MSRRGFELLTHTADTGFRAYAEDLNGVLEEACRALVAVAMDASRAVTAEWRTVEAAGETLEDLAVNLLNEVLWLIDGERWTPAVVEVKAGEGSAAARLGGEPRDDSRHPPRIVVKAATYHQIRIGPSGGGWAAEIYLDI
ncbi:MAG: archease [Bryobacteraceae bacterium]|nr:archease [Bryobacteraceae bacterium]